MRLTLDLIYRSFLLTSVAYGNNKHGLHRLAVQKTSNMGSDFIERFSIFKEKYDKALTKEEKNYIAKDFLIHCTEDEVSLVRSVIGDVLHYS